MQSIELLHLVRGALCQELLEVSTVKRLVEDVFERVPGEYL